jgi:hypothetical protein
MSKYKNNITNTNTQEQNSCIRGNQKDYLSESGPPPEAFKIIKRYGFEYTLLYAVRKYRYKHHMPIPSFLGFVGYALKSVKKLEQ